VVEAITRKMIRRHPHVFADQDGNLTPSHVKEAWERIKAEEKAERAARRPLRMRRANRCCRASNPGNRR
jgi:nucleoside triphosphate diphosphatase